MKKSSPFSRSGSLWLLGIAWLLLVGLQPQPAAAQSRDSLAVTYSPHVAFDCNMNMGPTGATVWMRGYQFVVTSIQEQSPAFERLMLGDVVTGAAGHVFGPDVDPRMTLGNAIGEAEATGQPIVLSVLRKGSPIEVRLTLAQLGAESPTWPAHCEKSSAILEQACQSLLETQFPDGRQVTDGSFGSFASGLLLLATGDSRFLDAARRAAHYAADEDYEAIDYANWPRGYGGILLAEYYLSTGDDSVLPKLKHIADVLAKGQMLCGSWGHKSPAGGYGALNQAGLVDAMTLVLAKECGLEVDEAAMNKSLDFFERFAGLGSVPYGDHYPGRSLDDNGKCAMAAVLMHLAGREESARVFADTVAESYWLREEGHTGGYFSIVWGPIGASFAGPEKLQKFLDYQRWYYNLARKWTGAITILPYKEALTRFDDSGYIYFGGEFTTGGIGLTYALPGHKLRIFGAPKGVFADVPMSGQLKTVRDLYLARNWSACDRALAEFDPSTLKSDDEKRYLTQLIDARALNKASTERVLAEIDCNLQNGSPYVALQQFKALKRCLGDQADPRFAQIEERFAESTNAWYVREGEQFYDRWQGMVGFGVKSWVPQGLVAKRMVEGVPYPRPTFWEPLSPVSDLQPQAWRTKVYAEDEPLDEQWNQPGFDDGNWSQGEGIQTTLQPARSGAKAGPIAARRTFTIDNTQGKKLRVRLRTVRTALTRVYLNGSLIVDVERGQRGGYASIVLDDRALDLLKKGENLLAVTSTGRATGNNQLDVSLEIDRAGIDRRHLPIQRLEAVPTADLPAADTTLHVDDATKKFREALTQSFMDKPVDELLKDLHTDIGYYRDLAEDALVNNGVKGVEPALALHDDPDWHARAAALGVMQKAFKQFTEAGDTVGLTLLEKQIPAVTGRLGDEHHWVRVEACRALANFKDKAVDAVPALVIATGDPVQWVRENAVAALQAIGADDKTMLAAMSKAVSYQNSSASIPTRALAVAGNPEGDTHGRLTILVDILKQPPECVGGTLLADIIDLGCQLDPDGKMMIPVLIDSAADKTDLSRQRGNPRSKAIEALGAYGPKASAAVETLKAILADDTGPAKQQHEPAQKALDAITGGA